MADLKVVFSAVLEPFERGVQKVKQITSNLKANFSGLKSFFAGAVAFTGLAMGISAIKDKITELDRTAKQSRIFGMSGGEFQGLSYAAEREGAKLDGVMSKVARILRDAKAGKAEGKEALGAIGLDALDFDGKSSFQIFSLIADAISKIPNAMTRAGAATKIFGDSGADLDGFLKNYKSLMDEAKQKDLLIPDDALANAEKISDLMTDIQKSWDVIVSKSGVFNLIAGAFEKIADATNIVKDISDLQKESSFEKRNSVYADEALDELGLSKKYKNSIGFFKGQGHSPDFYKKFLNDDEYKDFIQVVMKKNKDFVQAKQEKLKEDQINERGERQKSQRETAENTIRGKLENYTDSFGKRIYSDNDIADKMYDAKKELASVPVDVSDEAYTKSISDVIAKNTGHIDEQNRRKKLGLDIIEREWRFKCLEMQGLGKQAAQEKAIFDARQKAGELSEDEEKQIYDAAGAMYDLKNQKQDENPAQKSISIVSDSVLKQGGYLGGQANAMLQSLAEKSYNKQNDIYNVISDINNRLRNSNAGGGIWPTN